MVGKRIGFHYDTTLVDDKDPEKKPNIQVESL